MRRHPFFFVAFAAILAGCSSGTPSGVLPSSAFHPVSAAAKPQSKPADVFRGQSEALTFNGLGTAYAQTVTYDVPFEGEVSAVSADTSVASVNPGNERAVHEPGAGTKYASFTITPHAPGTTTVTITDKQGGTATIGVTVNGTKPFIVGNLYMSHVEEYAAGASGSAQPLAVMQSAYTERGLAFDPSGDLYVTTGAGVLVYSPGASAPARFIHGTQTQLNCAQGIATDAAAEVFVMNCGSITVYAASADGDTQPIRQIQISYGGPNVSIAADGAGDIFTYDPNNGNGAIIREYAAGAEGNAVPVRTITSAALADTPPWGSGIGVDAAGNIDVVSGNYNGVPDEIVKFAAGASGNASPSAVIDGASFNSQYLAVAPDGTIWVSAGNGPGPAGSLYAYAPDANGNVPPEMQFPAGTTQGYSTQIALDPSGNPYAGDQYDAVVGGYVASSGASLRRISLGTPGMGQINGVSIDASGNLYVANGWTGTIDVFNGIQNGSPAPARVINYVQAADAIADAQGYLYASSVSSNKIWVFAPGASGNAAPVRTITGPDTGLAQPFQITFDAQGNLYVANQGNSSVTVYAHDANGDAAPLRTIAGANTRLISPQAVAVDAAGNVYVGDAWWSFTAVVVFSPGANGDATPIRVLSGSQVPVGANALAVDAAGYIYQEGGNDVWIYAPGADGNTAPFRTVQMVPSEGGFYAGLALLP